MIKRKRKIPNENSNEYYQLLLEEYNRYERAVLLSDKKLGFLQEISPIIDELQINEMQNDLYILILTDCRFLCY